MKILRNLKVPTGNILVVSSERGSLEMLSLGDYGREHNVKADFLGITRNLDKVEHKELLPLEKKWVLTCSTQYGCACFCQFCDVPKIKFNGNATFDDLVDQFIIGLKLHPEVKTCDHLNLHWARMGEPSFNENVINATRFIYNIIYDERIPMKVHPVVSTMMPRHNKNLELFIHRWMYDIKNNVFEGNAGLQLSINSTDEGKRSAMFNDKAHKLSDIAEIMRGIVPIGRKITLNFAVAGYKIDSSVLLKYFNPAHYIIKLTPMHKTIACIDNNIKMDGDYTTYHPYKEYEASLKSAGYDVLVFIASKEEDLGRITCGNAILSGTLPLVPYTEENI